MAGIITALKVQRKNKNRVNVYLDNRYTFSLSLLQAARLKRGQFLSEEAIEALKSEDIRQAAYDQALKYLAYRPRSQVEMESYLSRKGLAEDVIQGVIDRLSQAGLLSDREFARFWVENRQRFRPRGRMALRHELRAKGLSEERISEALQDVDEEREAYSLACVQAKKTLTLAPQEFRRKLGQYLARRGFPYSIIETVLRRIERERTNPSEIGEESG